MEGQKNIILECNRINSIRVQSSGEDVDNKASWYNKTAPTILRRGDNINLENVLINVAGADTNSIQFNGDDATNTNPIQDNFMLMNVGFYVNDNRTNNAVLPVLFNVEEHTYDGLKVDRNRVEGGGDPATMTVNNNYGMYYNYQYFKSYNDDNPNPSGTTILRIPTIKSLNRFHTFKGQKMAKVALDYKGFMRSNNPTREGIDYTITRGETQYPELFTEDIPLSVGSGFISPDSLADELTIILNELKPTYEDDGKDLKIPTAYNKRDGVDGRKLLKMYHFNGYSYKTIPSNLQTTEDDHHRIYGSLLVTDPYRWKYGTTMIKNTDTYNLRGSNWIDPTLSNYLNYYIDYPVILWSRFIGDNPQPADRFDFQQYSIYSPSLSEIIETGDAYDDYVVSSTGLSSNFSDMNDVFRSIFNLETNGVSLCLQNNTWIFTRNEGTNGMKINDGGIDKPTTLLLDNDQEGVSDCIGWNRFYALGLNGGAWNSDEHEEVKTVAYDDFFTSYLSSPSSAIDSGFFERIQPETNYTPRSFVAINPSGGTSGVYYIYDWLQNNNIVAGAEYVLSFKTQYVGQDPNDGASSTQYAHAIGVADRSQYGMNGMSVTADGTYTQTWTATQSYSGNNFLMFSLNHGVPYEQQVAVTNISLLRKNLNQDETFLVEDYWTGDQLAGSGVEDNKIYRIKQNVSLQAQEVTISNNTAPSQGSFTGVDFNRTYKILDNGFMFVFDSNANVWKFSSGLTSNNSPNASVLYNNDDPNYTYWIYQKYGSTNWYMNRYSKFNGDNNILNNEVIGTTQGVEVNLKNKYRIEQQYYNLHNTTWTTPTQYIDFEIGNVWNTSQGGGGNPYTCNNYVADGNNKTYYQYNFSDGNNYDGGTVGYTYSFQESSGTTANGMVYDNILTIDTNAGNTFTIYLQTQYINGTQGIYEYNNNSINNTWTFNTTGGINGYGYITFTGAIGLNLSPSATVTQATKNFNYDYHFDGYHDIYLKVSLPNYDQGTYLVTLFAETRIFHNDNGTWSYDSATGTITLTRADGTFYANLYYQTTNPSTTTIQKSITFTNNITNPLPNLPTPLDTSKTYFSTFDYNGVTYYMSNNPNNPTDNQLNGFGGKVYYVDGGNQEQDWTYSNNNITMPSFNINGAGSVTLSTVLTGETSRSIDFNAQTYDIPKDGKGYGYDYATFGTSNFSQRIHDYLYLGFKNSSGTDNSPTSKRIVEGNCYDNIADFFTNPNGKTWELNADDNGTAKLIIKQQGQTLFSLTTYAYNILHRGWVFYRADRIIPSSVVTGGFQTNIQFNKTAWLSDSLTQTTEDATNIMYTLSTANDAGTTYTLKSLVDGTTVTTGTFKSFQDAYIDKSKANIVKHTLLYTNILMNDKNLKIMNDFFKYNEVAQEQSEIRSDVINSTNWVVGLDLGRADDGDIDNQNSHRDWTTNTSGRNPLIPQYMYDKGIMGQDDSTVPNDTVNKGCIFPTLRKKYPDNSNPPNYSYDDTKDEARQVINVFTRYQGDDYETRCIETNRTMTQVETGIYLYNRGVSLETFKTTYKSFYDYITTNNLGIVPINVDDNLCMAFEVSEDYNDGRLYTIQNFTYIGYSPSSFDNPKGFTLNNDAPAVDPNHYQWSGKLEDNTNWINIGATSPNIDYNNQVGKFSLSSFHTNYFYNSVLAKDDTSEIGDPIALFYTNKGIYYNEYTHPDQDQRERNLGIMDSQSGIFINDIYFQLKGTTNITSRSDDRAVLMTPENYFNSMPFRMGFSYYDLKPLNMTENSFNNRFKGLYYNTLINDYRPFTLRPFTTNSLIETGIALQGNVYTDNSGTEDTINPNSGLPKYYLGYNSFQPFTAELDDTTISDLLFTKSKPVNISSGYYRIFCDLPLDSLEYQDGKGNNLSCIGYALLNYASSQQYFYSYAQSFGSTLTKDLLLNQIKIEIRDDIGRVVRGLGTKCSVIVKVSRNFNFGIPPKSDEEEADEDRNKTNKLLEDVVEELQTDNLETNIEAEKGGKIPSNVNDENKINDFIEEIESSMIQTITNNILLPPALLSAVVGKKSRDKPESDKINRQIIRNLATGISSYMVQNRPTIQKIKQMAMTKGLNRIGTDPDFLKLIDELKNFVINSRGQLVKGLNNTTSNGILSITPEASKYLSDEINKQIITGGADKDKLNIYLNNIIGDMLNKTNDIQLNVNLKVPKLTKLQKDQIKQQIINRPFNRFKEQTLGISPKMAFDSKTARQLDQAYKYAQQAYENDDVVAGNVYMRSIINELRDRGVKIPDKDFFKSFGRAGIPQVEKMRRSVFMKEGRKQRREILKEKVKRDTQQMKEEIETKESGVKPSDEGGAGKYSFLDE